MTKEQRIAEMAKVISKAECYEDRIAEALVNAGYGNIKQAEAENKRLREELLHREEDLVHADENLSYREWNVVLHEKEIKKQAVKEFAEKYKEIMYKKMGKHSTLLGKEFVQRIMRETTNELLKEYEQ